MGHSIDEKSEKIYEYEWIWPRVIIIGYLYIAALPGLYYAFTSAKLTTSLFAIFLYQFSMWGVTAGVHRLWAHRTYKAKWPLRVLLMIMYTTAYTHSVIYWSREHRLHHKYTDTNADPYNAKRGFFFAHVIWLLTKKHPDVIEKGKGIDMSDLYSDPLVKYQHKYILPLAFLLAFILPTLIPMYFWNETLKNSFHVAAVLRWAVTFNLIGLVNSAAHFWGNKPYDKHVSAVENLTTTLLVSGEAWHNYHHAFPWDYKAQEWGKYWCNSTTAFIEFMAWLGLAYDLKTVSSDLVKHRIERTGDGSHEIWGWNDKDMPEEERKAAVIVAPKYSKASF